MSFFMMIMLFVMLARLSRRGRWRRRGLYWGAYAGPWAPHWHQYAYPQPVVPQATARPAALSPPDPFEALKTRYVQGDLTDEDYERELDMLLKTPEGRRTIR